MNTFLRLLRPRSTTYINLFKRPLKHKINFIHSHLSHQNSQKFHKPLKQRNENTEESIQEITKKLEKEREEREKHEKAESKDPKRSPFFPILVGALGGGGILTIFLQYVMNSVNLKKRIETALTSPVPSEIRENLKHPHEADLPDDYIDRPKEEERLKSILNEHHRGILVLTGPPRTGKSTLLAKILKGRPYVILVEMRQVKPEKRIETFIFEVCKGLGIARDTQKNWIGRLFSDEKDLRHELLIFYDTAIDMLRSELKALKGKTNGFVPLILIDDAQYLMDIHKMEESGHGVVQTLLNLGIFITSQDQTANFVIVSSDPFCKNFFNSNFQGIHDGRLAELPMIGEATREVAVEFLKQRSRDITEDQAGKIYRYLGGKFADLVRVDVKYPDRWLSSKQSHVITGTGQAESEVLKIRNLFESSSPHYTHAQLLKVIEMLCTDIPASSKGPGYCSLIEMVEYVPERVLQALVREHLIGRRSDLDDELAEKGASVMGHAYITAYSTLTYRAMKEVLPHLALILKVKHSKTEDEPRKIELRELTLEELKSKIFTKYAEDAAKIVIKNNQEIEESKDLLQLNNWATVEFT